MKYKVGDHVRIKSLDWYNKNKDIHGDIWFDNAVFGGGQSLYCGCELTIRLVTYDSYYVIENDYYWTDEMIEGLVEEKKSLCEGCCSLELKYNKLTIADNICTDKVEIILQDYELKKEGDKWFAEKKKKEYPKTYEECKYILGITTPMVRPDYNGDLIVAFQKLLICRDAYWKIAGEEMGLGKPWEPDWEENSEKSIITKFRNAVAKFNTKEQYTFAFPTEEMRDAFYENFKGEIEQCKELL